MEVHLFNVRDVLGRAVLLLILREALMRQSGCARHVVVQLDQDFDVGIVKEKERLRLRNKN